MPNPANRAEPSTSAAGGAGLHAVCDLQVVPVGAGSSVSEWVAAVVAMVAEAEKTGEIAAYRLHAGGTVGGSELGRRETGVVLTSIFRILGYSYSLDSSYSIVDG